MDDTDREVGGDKGILTTKWTEYASDIASQWSLEEEYNGRGFDKDVEIFEIKDGYGA